MGKQAPPSAPDYAGAAQAQGIASQQNTEQQTWANRPDVYTPYGAQTWQSSPTWDPVSGQWMNQWTQNVQLAQPLQDAAQSQMNIARGRSQMGEQLLQNAGSSMLAPMDWGSLPQAGQGIGQFAGGLLSSLDFSSAPQIPGSAEALNQRGIDAAMNQYQSRLDPQWQQQDDQTRTRLYNQGLREGDAAFDQEMGNLSRQRNDAYQSAMNASVAQGAQIGGQLFNQGMAARQQGVNELGQQGAFQNQAAQQAMNMGQQASAYQNQLRQQAIAEQMQRQGWDLNRINAFLAGQQVGMPSFPGFTNAGAAQAPNYLGAMGMQGQYGMDLFGAQQGQAQGAMAGASQIASILPFFF